jgi:hypothetical protein
MKYFRIKEVRLMAKPITATPILTGSNLMRLIKDVQRPDNAQDLRERASQSLNKVVNRGKAYVPRHI